MIETIARGAVFIIRAGPIVNALAGERKDELAEKHVAEAQGTRGVLFPWMPVGRQTSSSACPAGAEDICAPPRWPHENKPLPSPSLQRDSPTEPVWISLFKTRTTLKNPAVLAGDICSKWGK